MFPRNHLFTGLLRRSLVRARVSTVPQGETDCRNDTLTVIIASEKLIIVTEHFTRLVKYKRLRIL